jgi:prevent-host-death family protein
MAMNWQLQEAKNRLSELVKEAHISGSQVITVHGKEAAVVMSAEEYRKLKGQEENLADFFLRPRCAAAIWSSSVIRAWVGRSSFDLPAGYLRGLRIHQAAAIGKPRPVVALVR